MSAELVRLGVQIKRARLARKLRQGDVGRIIGVSVATMSAYETGTKSMSAIRLLRLGHLLKLDLERTAIAVLNGRGQ